MNDEKIEDLFAEAVVPEQPEVSSTAFADLPPVEPVDSEATDKKEEKKDAENSTVSKEVLEHPDAKVTLQHEEEEVVDKEEIEELKNVKLMDNSSLKFVLILGLIFLVFIFLIPIISKYL